MICSLGLYRKIGNNIAAIRNQCYISQAKIAAAIGVHKGTFSNIEVGRCRTEYGTFKAIAELFQIDIKDLEKDDLLLEDSQINFARQQCGLPELQ